MALSWDADQFRSKGTADRNNPRAQRLRLSQAGQREFRVNTAESFNQSVDGLQKKSTDSIHYQNTENRAD